MGNQCSKSDGMSALKDRILKLHINQLEHDTKFSKSEIEGLFEQFWMMACKENVNYTLELPPMLSYSDLLKFTDTRNPIHDRIILAFMGVPKGNDLIHQIARGRLDFPTFVRRMAIFGNSTPQEKLAFIFRIYDQANNEVINIGDVKALLADMYGEEMTDAERDSSARNFMAEFGNSEEITKDKFISTCEGTSVDDMVVRFS